MPSTHVPKTKVRGLPERQQPEKQIIVYVCPTENCPDYYAATDFVPTRTSISAMQWRRNQHDGSMQPSHPRIACPLCREKGKYVFRVPYIVTEVLPYEEVENAARHHVRAVAS